FLWQTLTRSRLHRLALQFAAGAALAWAGSGVLDYADGTRGNGSIGQFAAVWVPLCAAVGGVAGVRYLTGFPFELRARWLFQLAEAEGRESWRRAVDRFLV